MIGFESGLTGEDAVRALTQATELFSGDMEPARIRDVVYKFETESGGYKEVDAFEIKVDTTKYKPVIVVRNSNDLDRIDLVLKNANLLELLNTNQIKTTGFHRIKFIKGIAFGNDYDNPYYDPSGIEVFKDIYIDVNISGEKFYGEFLVPGIFKGVFASEGRVNVSVDSLLCPIPTNHIGTFEYSKPANNDYLSGFVDLAFYSDVLLISPKSFRSPNYVYALGDNQERFEMSINFNIGSSTLVANINYTTSYGGGNTTLDHTPNNYSNSFQVYVPGQYTYGWGEGSLDITAPPMPTMSDYLPFRSGDSFINT